MWWWTDCWSAGSGRSAAAVVRIAIAIALLMLLDRLRELAPIAHRWQSIAAVENSVVIASRIEVVADRPIERWIQAEVDRDDRFRSLHRVTDLTALRARTAAALDEMQRRYPRSAIRGVRIYATMYQIPASPAPARLAAHDLGILGEVIGGVWDTRELPIADDQVSLAEDPALEAAALTLYRDGLVVAGPAPQPDASGWLRIPSGRDMVVLVAQLRSADGVMRPYVIARRVEPYW
jgi:hypothetical protein